MISRIKSISLAMGSATMATIVVLLGMFLLVESIPSQRALHLDPPNFTARVQSAASCESMRSLCLNLAQGYEVQSAHIAAQNHTVDELLKRVTILVGGWGVLSSLAFLYIFWAARRYEMETKVAL